MSEHPTAAGDALRDQILADLLKQQFARIDAALDRQAQLIEQLRAESSEGRRRVYVRVDTMADGVARLEGQVVQLRADLDALAFDAEVLAKIPGLETRLAAAERQAAEVPQLKRLVARHERGWRRVAGWSALAASVAATVVTVAQSLFGDQAAAAVRRFFGIP